MTVARPSKTLPPDCPFAPAMTVLACLDPQTSSWLSVFSLTPSAHLPLSRSASASLSPWFSLPALPSAQSPGPVSAPLPSPSRITLVLASPCPPRPIHSYHLGPRCLASPASSGAMSHPSQPVSTPGAHARPTCPALGSTPLSSQPSLARTCHATRWPIADK